MRFNVMAVDEQERVIALFLEYFSGREQTYAIRMEPQGGRAYYVPTTYDGDSEYVKEELGRILEDIGGGTAFGPDAVRAHLEGRYLIGVYPIQEDSACRFFALDFDDKEAGDPWQEAQRYADTLFSEAGLSTYIERSQSGNGFHVWGFLEEPVNAGVIRHALSPFIEKKDTFDRMFPNQEGISETLPLGNLIALPFHGQRMVAGNSSFVEADKKGEPKAVKPQFGVLDQFEKIPVSIMQELFEKAGEYQPPSEVTKYEGDAEGLEDGWKVTHPRFGCEWVRWCYENPTLVDEPQWYALACNFAQLENGRELFHEWSAQDGERYSSKVTDKKYDQAVRKNKPHACEAIRALGGNCECDLRFPGRVHHPFDLATISFRQLVDSVGQEAAKQVTAAPEGFDEAIQWALDVEANPEEKQGWRYGIDEIDVCTRLRPSDLVVLAGRPGQGKTALASCIADALCCSGTPVYFFSAEMSSQQLYRRQLALRAEVSATSMATGSLGKEEWSRIKAARGLISDEASYPLFVDDLSQSMDQIWEAAAKFVHTHGLGVVIVDYMQLLRRKSGESEFDAVTRIAHDLKYLAKCLQVPVLALSQLNRSADDATAESQTYDSWLRSSGAIEQCSDVILFILGDKGGGVRQRMLAVHKERHREAGMRIPLEFNQPFMRFAAAGTWQLTHDDIKAARKGDAPTNEDDDFDL